MINVIQARMIKTFKLETDRNAQTQIVDTELNVNLNNYCKAEDNRPRRQYKMTPFQRISRFTLSTMWHPPSILQSHRHHQLLLQ